MRFALVLSATLAAGLILGAAGSRLLGSDTETAPTLRGEGTLRDLPDGPVNVRAETVLLPAGFRSRHLHGGPTFNAVESGTIEIEDELGINVYGPGDFFFEPADHPHEIRVLTDARLDVVRLLPPGAPETTELP